MECPGCGRPITPRERWSWAGQWCSASCRRRMVRELRDVSLFVARCSAAIEMPDTIRHRDELVRRFAATAVKPAREEWRPDREPEVEAGSLMVAVMDDDDLPLYF